MSLTVIFFFLSNVLALSPGLRLILLLRESSMNIIESSDVLEYLLSNEGEADIVEGVLGVT